MNTSKNSANNSANTTKVNNESNFSKFVNFEKTLDKSLFGTKTINGNSDLYRVDAKKFVLNLSENDLLSNELNKKARIIIRKKKDKFLSAIHFCKDEKTVETLCKQFIEFYNLFFTINDFSENSIFESNTSENNQKIYRSALAKVIKYRHI